MNIDDLGPGYDRGAALVRAIAQDAFEARLIQEQPPAGAQRVDAFVQVRDDVRKLPARECVHGDDRAVGDELLFRLAPYRLFDADAPEHLESSHMKEGRAW